MSAASNFYQEELEMLRVLTAEEIVSHYAHVPADIQLYVVATLLGQDREKGIATLRGFVTGVRKDDE